MSLMIFDKTTIVCFDARIKKVFYVVATCTNRDRFKQLSNKVIYYWIQLLILCTMSKGIHTYNNFFNQDAAYKLLKN